MVAFLAALSKLIKELKGTFNTTIAQIGFLIGTISSTGQGDEPVLNFERYLKTKRRRIGWKTALQKAVEREITREEPVRQTILEQESWELPR